MNQHLAGLTEWRQRQRTRIKERLAASERRRERRAMDIDITNDIDEPLTALSDSLSAFTLEVKS